MSVRRIILLNVLAILVILGVLYAGFNYYYARNHYVSTDNAFVEGDEYPINAEIAGKLLSWDATDGESVKSGQVLGKVDPAAALQQAGPAARNPQVAQAVAAAADITSPIDGTLLGNAASVGQAAAPGQPLAYVVDLSKLYVVANVSEQDIRHVQVGQQVDVYIDAFPNQSFKGTVTSIGLYTNSLFALIPPTDGASGTYTKVTQTIPVKIALDGYGGAKLLPGMSVTVRIHRNTD